MDMLAILAMLLAVVAALVVVAKTAAFVATKSVWAKSPQGTHGESLEVSFECCMEAAIMVLGYTKSALKEERLESRRARARAWHIVNCAAKEAARKARKEAMGYISSAQRKAENRKKANQFMVGKSWQEAISALYNEGKLVSVRKRMEIKTAVMRTKTPRVMRGAVLVSKPADRPSVAQAGEEYKKLNPVVGEALMVRDCTVEFGMGRAGRNRARWAHAVMVRRHAMVNKLAKAKAWGVLFSEEEKGALMAKMSSRDYQQRKDAFNMVQNALDERKRELDIQNATKWHNRAGSCSAAVYAACMSRNKEVRKIGRDLAKMESSAVAAKAAVAPILPAEVAGKVSIDSAYGVAA
ncbi:hypothetical protein KC976_04345 [Candidatus Saccharibacteria bacterium]|nr:hypothetical protein [Candidatus Saccharibacteria bacterium]